MPPTTLERAAAAAALGMALLMVLLQFVLTPTRQAPTALFLTFTAVWVFGAVMLVTFPRFGAAGTALFGLLSAWGAWRMHAFFRAEDVALVGGSLLAAGLAGWALARRVRASQG